MPFDAILFDPVGTTSSKVLVRVLGSSLEVVGSAETMRVDPSRCALSAGGWDHESIQITWSREGSLFTLSSKDPAAKADLSRLPHFETALKTALQVQTSTRRRGRLGLTMVAGVTLLPLLVLLSLFAFRDRIIDLALERIPVTVDQEIGKMFEGEILTSKEAVPANEATRAIRLIVDRLAAALPGGPAAFKVSVQRNQEVNAFAAPGGLIVVNTGLINEADSAEEVAGVLAHEMAHVTRRHSMRQMIYAGGLLPLAGMLVGSPDAVSLFQSFGQLEALKFSRAQEEDADRTGFETLVATHTGTEGMARFFDRLVDTEGTPPAFLSTHPSSAGRAAAVRARTKALSGATVEPLAIDWNAVKTALR